MTAAHTAYLSLGSNLGQRQRNIQDAVEMINARAGRVVRLSPLHETLPWGFESDNTFLNAALCLHTKLSPLRLLDVTQEIEREMGRKEKSAAGVYHDRIIDIDILLYDDLHINTPRLTIPHPLMRQRDFVMTPLREIIQEDETLLR